MQLAGQSTKQGVDRASSSALSLQGESRVGAPILTLGVRRRLAVRILVVEDEKKVAKALQEGLEAEGYAVTIAGDGELGFEFVGRQAFDLVLLDLALPRRDGIDMLASLRKSNCMTPVFILTATDADDYMVKPFTFPELLARIRALLRRGRADSGLRLQHEDLWVDLATRKVARGEQSLELTGKEFEILECLLRHR